MVDLRRSDRFAMCLVPALVWLVGLLPSQQALAQQACRPESICFERGEAQFDELSDLDEFLRQNHEKIGLTGEERFECRRQSWIAELNRGRAEHAFLCVQTAVRGYETANLMMRVDFWPGADGVRSVRCTCVREDTAIAAPRWRSDELIDRGLVHVYAHFPEVDAEAVEVTSVEGPFVEADPSIATADAYRTSWHLTFAFPWVSDPLAGNDAEAAVLRLSIDAVTQEIFRAVDVEDKLYRFGIPGTAIDEFQKRAATIEDRDEQFDAYVRFWAYRAKGDAAAPLIERHLRSLAAWEPGLRSRYIVFFTEANSIGDVARFLTDHELAPLSASYMFEHDGKVSGRSLEGFGSDTESVGAEFRRLVDDERRMANDALANTPPGASNDSAMWRLAGVAEPESMRFDSVTVSLTHADALALYEAERERRVFIMAPVDQPASSFVVGGLFY